MDVKAIKPGMWVECRKQGVAEVIEVDAAHNAALVERMSDHKRVSVNCDDISEQPQLHTGCDSYY